MADDLTADEIRRLLKLEPNATCGYVRETYLSKLSIAPGGLPAPFADGRPLGSALYFMMSPAAPVKLHRIKNHQLYHHYLGDPIEVLMLHDDGTHTLAVVGSDLRAGQRVQLFIPGNTFHTARIIGSAPLVPRRQHRMARCRSDRGRRTRQRRRARCETPRRCRRDPQLPCACELAA